MGNRENSERSSEILRKSGLRRTLGRVKIIEILMESHRPLSICEITKLLGKNMIDPASVYRVLNTFHDKGIVHRVDSSDNINRFALNRGEKAHPHFTCRLCGRVECLRDIPVPPIDANWKGYLIEERSFCLQGLCPGCIESSGDSDLINKTQDV
jgi:Fur family ferric uptake transcriptional regulator